MCRLSYSEKRYREMSNLRSDVKAAYGTDLPAAMIWNYDKKAEYDYGSNVRTHRQLMTDIPTSELTGHLTNSIPDALLYALDRNPPPYPSVQIHLEQTDVDARSFTSLTVNLCYHFFLMDLFNTSSTTHFRHYTHDVYVADEHGVLLAHPRHPLYIQADRAQQCEQFYHKQLSPDNMRLDIPVGMKSIWSMAIFYDHVVICHHHLLHNTRSLV